MRFERQEQFSCQRLIRHNIVIRKEYRLFSLVLGTSLIDIHDLLNDLRNGFAADVLPVECVYMSQEKKKQLDRLSEDDARLLQDETIMNGLYRSSMEFYRQGDESIRYVALGFVSESLQHQYLDYATHPSALFRCF